MNDEMTLTLNSPITEEQWDAITDVDFDYTDRIWFNTKHGKSVEFIKKTSVPRWIPCSERLPEEEVDVLVSGWDIDYDTSLINTGYMKRGKWETEESYEYGHEIRVDAWQPLPEPYMEENNG